MRGVRTHDTFNAVIDCAMADPTPPDAILATGDLVQDETRTGYETFRTILEKCDVPVYCIPGNHDAPQIMSDVLSPSPFQVCGTVHHGNWLLIMLNSFCRGQDSGRLTPEELHRLEEALSANPTLHTLICVHHHPIPMGSRWLDGVALRNADEFFDIIDHFAQVRGILWGHVHQASDRWRGRIRLMSSPSTCSQFLPNSDDFALDDRPPGFRWLDLRENGSIHTRVVWLE
jgi:Icc protein